MLKILRKVFFVAPPQQQPSNFGKAKRGAPAAGAAPTFHPYQR